MENQPNNHPQTGNNNEDKDEDKKDTDGKDSEPKVYQGGNSSNDKHANEPKP